MIGSGKPTTGRPAKGNYREGRDKKLCIRISYHDLKRLDFICEYYGITKTDFIISAIEEATRKVVNDVNGNNT